MKRNPGIRCSAWLCRPVLNRQKAQQNRGKNKCEMCLHNLTVRFSLWSTIRMNRIGQLKDQMKKIIVKLETNCEHARAKFAGSMRSFVMRLKFPASLELTDEGAVLEMETNEMRKIQTEIRALKIAARCVAFGLKEATL